MANINLLPWRDWERERKKKAFIAQTVSVLLVGITIIFGVGQVLNNAILTQEGRNTYLQGRIAVLDKKIEEIKTLREEREDLLARMRVINELQGNRPVIVRIFDEVVQTLAKGVHYQRLEMTDRTLKVAGVAESNNRISALMRNIDESDWFASPNLKGIKEDPTNADYGEQASTFDLSFVQINPSDGPEEDL